MRPTRPSLSPALRALRVLALGTPGAVLACNSPDKASNATPAPQDSAVPTAATVSATPAVAPSIPPLAPLANAPHGGSGMARPGPGVGLNGADAAVALAVPSGLPSSLPPFPSGLAIPTALPMALPSVLPPGFPSALPPGLPPGIPTALPSAWPTAIPTAWPVPSK